VHPGERARDQDNLLEFILRTSPPRGFITYSYSVARGKVALSAHKRLVAECFCVSRHSISFDSCHLNGRFASSMRSRKRRRATLGERPLLEGTREDSPALRGISLFLGAKTIDSSKLLSARVLISRREAGSLRKSRGIDQSFTSFRVSSRLAPPWSPISAARSREYFKRVLEIDRRARVLAASVHELLCRALCDAFSERKYAEYARQSIYSDLIIA